MGRPDFGKCETANKNKLIPLEERRCKITFLNPSRKKIRKIVVDKCQLKGLRSCDFLLIDEAGQEYFVELKGSDTKKAVSQLESAIEKISASSQTHPKTAYIVVGKKNPMTGPSVQNHVTKFKAKYGAILKVRRSGWEEPINA